MARVEKPLVPCVTCGTPVTSAQAKPPLRFCSLACASEATDGLVCPRCGEPGGAVHSRHGEFCSDRCRTGASVARGNGSAVTLDERLRPVTCVGCGVEFVSSVSKQRFCSRLCCAFYRQATGGWEQLHLDMPVGLVRSLQDQARRQGRPVAAVVTDALEAALCP